MKFILSSTEFELLLQFESNASLESLAGVLGRDPTVISKQLKRISEKGDFLTKVGGRWRLTSIGKSMNQLTRDYILAQNKTLQSKVHLTIGTTREFATLVLGKNFNTLKKELNVDSLSVLSFEEGIEKALLQGKIEIGFDCGRPYSPDIVYKQVLEEPIVAVATKTFAKKLKTIESFSDLEEFPHILCHRLHPDKVQRGRFNLSSISAQTNDIATARSLCLANVGWALLPKYAVKSELSNNKLVVIKDLCFKGEKYSVLQMRARKNLTPYFERAIDWMKNHLKSLDGEFGN